MNDFAADLYRAFYESHSRIPLEWDDLTHAEQSRWRTFAELVTRMDHLGTVPRRLARTVTVRTDRRVA